MRLFGLLASLVLLVTSLSFGTGSYTGTTKFDTAIITSLITGDVRGFFRAWELSTSDDTVTVDVNGFLEIAADSGTTFTGAMTFDQLIVSGTSLFNGVATFDDTLAFDLARGTRLQVSGIISTDSTLIADAGVFTALSSDTLDTRTLTLTEALEGAWANFTGIVSSDSTMSAESLYVRNAKINETLTVDSINVADLTATGTVDLGGITDTLVIGADSFQVLNGVIVLKF